MWTRLAHTDGTGDSHFVAASYRNAVVLPWNPPRLHLVGHGNVSGPDVVLPAFLTQDPPQDRAAVDSNAHVHVRLGLLSDVPADVAQSVER